MYNPFRGIEAYFRVLNGTIKKNGQIRFMATGKDYLADEIGVLKLDQEARKEIKAGDVGYLISGIKEAREVKVGDTITSKEQPALEPISGFEEVKPMVFAGIYPVDTEDFEDLRASLEKLQLNDASLTFEAESSAALGFGFPLWIPGNAAHGDHSRTPRTRVQHDGHHHGTQCILSGLPQIVPGRNVHGEQSDRLTPIRPNWNASRSLISTRRSLPNPIM